MFEAVMENKDTKSNDKNVSVFIKIAALIIVITSGLLFLLADLILSVISFVNQRSFHGWDVILLVAAFVLFGIGAHFLDLIERDKKAKRTANYKKYGLTI